MILEINGRRVEVGPEFAQMTPEEQQAAVEEIARNLPSQIAGNVPRGTSYDPARGLTEAAAQGVTMGFGDELAGLAGAYANNWGGAFNQVLNDAPPPAPMGETYRDIRDASRRNLEQFAEEQPGAALAAEIGGGLLTGGMGAAKAGLVRGVKDLPKAATLGATQGGVYGEGAAEGDETGADEAMIGGLLGAVLPGAGMAGKAMVNKLMGGQVTREAQNLMREGVSSLTRSQALGQKQAQGLEGTLQKMPWIGNPLVEATHKGRREFQSALMQKAGFPKQHVDSGLITDDAIIQAGREFSERYATALRGKTLDLTSDEFFDKLSKSVLKHSKFVGKNQRKEFTEVLAELADEARAGPMDAVKAHEYRALLSDLAWTNREERIGKVYRAMRDALDDEFDKIGGIRELNRNYSRFRQVRDAYESSGAIETAEGILPLNQLERRSKKANIKDTDWRELINSAQRTLPDKLPDSGTASRAATLKLISNAVAPTAGAAWLGGLPGAAVPAAMIGAGRLASSYMASGRIPNMLDQARQWGLLVNPMALPLLGSNQ